MKLTVAPENLADRIGLALVRRADQPRAHATLLDLYFAVTSLSGTWSVEEISGWQRDAGLVPRKPIRQRSAPGAAEVIARK